jgi:hypothetical protein
VLELHEILGRGAFVDEGVHRSPPQKFPSPPQTLIA